MTILSTTPILIAATLGIMGLFEAVVSDRVARPLQAIPWPALVTEAEGWRVWRGVPDTVAVAIVENYVATLADLGVISHRQGIWVQAGPGAIASHGGEVPLPAASLTKMATTLTALALWPPDHAFETLVGRQGPVVAGVLEGDLIVQGAGDPYFVWEEAIALGHGLRAAGIERVTGNLIIQGPFTMNFEPDPARSGELLRQGLNANLWPGSAQQQYAALPTPIPPPVVVIEGDVVVNPGGDSIETPVIGRRSLPLVALLKAMNIYSNNEMAETFAQLLGGAEAISAQSAQITQLPPAEIQLINGSGLGMENQMSPRAAVAILQEIQAQLEPAGLTVADVMPIFGQEVGTLAGRQLPRQAAVKTGSLAVVSSLAGVFPTRDRGLVWFAILNEGGTLQSFRDRQDSLLATLQAHWGNAPVPDSLHSHVRLGQPPYQLGDLSRNQPYP